MTAIDTGLVPCIIQTSPANTEETMNDLIKRRIKKALWRCMVHGCNDYTLIMVHENDMLKWLRSRFPFEYRQVQHELFCTFQGYNK